MPSARTGLTALDASDFVVTELVRYKATVYNEDMHTYS
jgi:hypothetical protein